MSQSSVKMTSTTAQRGICQATFPLPPVRRNHLQIGDLENYDVLHRDQGWWEQDYSKHKITTYLCNHLQRDPSVLHQFLHLFHPIPLPSVRVGRVAIMRGETVHPDLQLLHAIPLLSPLGVVGAGRVAVVRGETVDPDLQLLHPILL